MSKTCHYHHHHLHFRSWHSGCVGQALISAQPLLERRPRGASDCKTLQCLLPHSIPPLSLFSLYLHQNWQMLQMDCESFARRTFTTPKIRTFTTPKFGHFPPPKKNICQEDNCHPQFFLSFFGLFFLAFSTYSSWGTSRMGGGGAWWGSHEAHQVEGAWRGSHGAHQVGCDCHGGHGHPNLMINLALIGQYYFE